MVAGRDSVVKEEGDPTKLPAQLSKSKNISNLKNGNKIDLQNKNKIQKMYQKSKKRNKKGDQTKLTCETKKHIATCSFVAPNGKIYGLEAAAKVYPVDLLMTHYHH